MQIIIAAAILFGGSYKLTEFILGTAKENEVKQCNKVQIENFVGVWLVSHLAFLNNYSDNKNNSLKIAENEIFKIGYMRKFKLKYFLKKRLPFIHDKIVYLKKRVSNN